MDRFQQQKVLNAQIASVLNVLGGDTLDPVFSIPGLVWPGDA